MIVGEGERPSDNICDERRGTRRGWDEELYSARCRYDAGGAVAGLRLGMASLLPSRKISERWNGREQWSGRQDIFNTSIFWVWFYLPDAIQALVRTFVSLSYIRVAMRKDVGRFESIDWLAGGFHFAVRASTYGAAEPIEAEAVEFPWHSGNTAFRSRRGNAHADAGFYDPSNRLHRP